MNARTFILFITAVLFACNGKQSSVEKQRARSSANVAIKYAEGFTVQTQGDAKLVTVTYPFQGAKSGYEYLLVPLDEEVPAHDENTKVIFVPVNDIVCTSTTHIPLLDYLNETNKLVGFPTTDYISSEKMRRRVDAGKVMELGIDKGLNLERLAVLNPDVVMGYTMTGDYGQFRKIESLGIPVVINAEYLEQHPLGRAEWIKFMALFFGKERMADSVFTVIEENYLQAKALVEQDRLPTVLSGIVYGDAWFLPGGENYAAKLFRDAGCEYLWADTKSNGFLRLSFETVYHKGRDADLWVGTGTYKSLADLAAADRRYADFKAFRTEQVYNYDARQGAKGGNEFLELGYLRPDLILRDLIRIAHPRLLPDHELYFHRKLE